MFKCCFILNDAFLPQHNQNVKNKNNLKRTLAEISPWVSQNDMTITSDFFMIYKILDHHILFTKVSQLLKELTRNNYTKAFGTKGVDLLPFIAQVTN